jgi:tRNA A-37 threonylcarbamoyl transferase component Bud32
VLFKRPRDVTAVAAGIFLCCLGTANSYLSFPNAGVIWRQIPLLIQILAFPAVVLGNNGLPAAPTLAFSLVFPKPVLERRWAWTTLAVLTAPAVVVSAISNYVILFAPKSTVGAFPLWLAGLIGVDFLGTFLGAVLMFVVNYFKVRDANERRRVRLVLLGLLIFFADLIAFFLFSSIPKTRWLGAISLSPLVFGLAQVPFTVCVAYAVLKQRLFQVSFIVRQSLQYAVARGALLIPIPILAGSILFDLLSHKNQPFGVLLSAHGWVYAFLGVAGIVAHKKQSEWMDVLDRRFYREHYDAQHLLRQTVDEIRAASSIAEVAPSAVTRIEQALHPEFVSILMREAGEPTFRCIASAPRDVYPHGLSAEGKLMAAFRLFARPLPISLAESGWLKQQLPSEDTNFLRNARIDLMVPIAIAPNTREALMVLGPKKSEEPYGREDQDLLSGIGSALALLLERPVISTPGGFEECPRCGLCYESGSGHCTQEGAPLTRVSSGRLLVSRYRLERRLGRGGMGTVYKAMDTALERSVAVKLIREDLITSKDAAERFRREAKASAACAHPNLVTVYDFGVDPDTRVFLVMELLEGATLRHRLELKKRFTTPEIMDVVSGVSAGLEAAHENGLVHRDLKPENIFLARSGGREVAKILDFGLAKFLVLPTETFAPTVGTVTGILVGTPQYMSPNQLSGEAASAAWDIWALAVIAYEMLTGAHPFPAPSIGMMQHLILSGRAIPVSTHLPEAPPEYQRFFDHALSPDTTVRPQSAAEFLSSLETAFALSKEARQR